LTLLAATATPVAANKTNTMTTPSPPRAPILDEDPLDEIVTDLTALAEVKFPMRHSTFPIPFVVYDIYSMSCN